MKKITLTTALLLPLIFAGVCRAQEERAVITGTVTDPSHASVAGATVTIDSKATGFHREISTNDSGAYLIPGLLIGVYDVHVSVKGFETQDYNAVQLAVGQIRTINAQMQIAANSQQVQVVAETQALDTSTAKLAGVVDFNQVSELPINGRAWTALMALVPGAMDSGGGTQKSIRFAGRGVTTTISVSMALTPPESPTRPRIRPPACRYPPRRSPNSKSTPCCMEPIRAVRPADRWKRFPNPVPTISMAARSNIFRNNVLNTRGPFDGSTLPPLRLNQYGSNLGGRIIKNRTFFFIDYEGLRQRLGTHTDWQRSERLRNAPCTGDSRPLCYQSSTPFRMETARSRRPHRNTSRSPA